MSDHFADDELALLREHGIVLFAERVIFDAQPPMAVEQIAALQELCAGPLPPASTTTCTCASTATRRP